MTNIYMHHPTQGAPFLKRRLQSRFSDSMLKTSLKTVSGKRNRHSSAFFMPPIKDSQSFIRDIRTLKIMTNSLNRGLSRRFYGVVDTVEYKTRKGNMPGRLTAESKTTSPNSLLGDLSLKLLGINTMLQFNSYQIEISNPELDSIEHKFLTLYRSLSPENTALLKTKIQLLIDDSETSEKEPSHD